MTHTSPFIAISLPQTAGSERYRAVRSSDNDRGAGIPERLAGRDNGGVELTTRGGGAGPVAVRPVGALFLRHPVRERWLAPTT